MMIVSELLEKDKYDSFKIMLESPLSLQTITDNLAKEFGLFLGKTIESGLENQIDYRRGYLRIKRDGINQIKDIIIESPENGVKPSETYEIKENNLERGKLGGFYKFLETKFG